MTVKHGMKSHDKGTENTFIKGLSLHSFAQGGGAARVDTKNGKIVRFRPLYYDEKYTPEEIGQWKIEPRPILDSHIFS